MDSNFELGEINQDAANRLARQVVIPILREKVFPQIGSEPFRLRDEVYAILKNEVEKGSATVARANDVSLAKRGNFRLPMPDELPWA